MRATLKIILLLVSLLVCARGTPASAETYGWVPLTADGDVNGSPVGLFSLGFISFEPALGGDNFSYSGECFPSGPPPFFNCAPGFSNGDFGSFTIEPSILGGMKPILLVDIDVTFNNDGTLSGVIDYNDDGADFFTSGTGNSWTGQFNSDFINCSNPTPCEATGYWQGAPIPAPEPPTWALLLGGMGVIGAAASLKQMRR
jgi:hypothetical protein